jgi:hypothetical protein
MTHNFNKTENAVWLFIVWERDLQAYSFHAGESITIF